MNFDTLVSKGQAPWLPSNLAAGLDVWLADDIPTVGTFRHGHAVVLFTAVGDLDHRLTVWAYTVLGISDVEAAKGLSSVEGCLDFVDNIFGDAQRSVMMCLARDFAVSFHGEFERLPVSNVPESPTQSASDVLMARANAFLLKAQFAFTNAAANKQRVFDRLQHGLNELGEEGLSPEADLTFAGAAEVSTRQEQLALSTH